MQLASHFGDACGVVRNGAESIFRHDDASCGEHAHAAQCNEIERELNVSATHPDCCAERDGDAQNCIHRRLETRCSARKNNRCWSGLGALGDFFNRTIFGASEIFGKTTQDLGENQTDKHGAEDTPARICETCLLEFVVADIISSQQIRADDGDDAGGEKAAVDWLQRICFAIFGAHGEHAGD